MRETIRNAPNELPIIDSRARWRKVLVNTALGVAAVVATRLLTGFAENERFISSFTEDLITLIVAAIVFIPVVRSISLAPREPRLKGALVASSICVLLNRILDLTDEIPGLQDVFLLGGDGYHSFARDFLGVMVFVGLFWAVFKLALSERSYASAVLEELVRTTASLVGKKFFPGLVSGIERSLDLRYVSLVEHRADHTRRTVAASDPHLTQRIERLWNENEWAPNCDEPAHRSASDFSALKELSLHAILSVPLKSSAGACLGHLIVAHDREMPISHQDFSAIQVFSARAAAELERIRSEEEHRALESRMVDLQKLEGLGTLAGGVAHDFSNLLVGVIGHTDVLLRSVEPRSKPWESARQVRAAALQASGMCKQMLSYSTQSLPEDHIFDVNRVARDCASLVRPVISKTIALELELADEELTVRGDSTRIHQVLINLLNNAADAIAPDAGSIRIHSRLDRNFVVLEIEDDGQGIDEETKKRIFDPFFSTKAEGRGLGLASTQGIIRHHRGAIEVQSVPGHGSRFEIVLPLTQRDHPEPTRAAVTLPPAPEVLVVDDDPRIRDVIEIEFRAAGIELLVAEDGQKGLDLYIEHKERISALIIDLVMPNLDGVEMLRELRHLGSTTPVIVMSGFNPESAIAELSTPHVRFIQKPFSCDQVLEILAELLEPRLQSESST
ncbi:MAG: ATP-binding protein [Planctomycetota bacterium]